MEKEDLINYWLDSSNRDYITMHHLFEQKDFLVTVTTFNIRARYDDYKLAFYKTCTKEFTEKWISEIEGFRKWLNDRYLR